MTNCAHIESSDEGTHWCNLAQGNGRQYAAMLALLRKIAGDEYLRVEVDDEDAGWNNAVDLIAQDAKEILKEIDVTKHQ